MYISKNHLENKKSFYFIWKYAHLSRKTDRSNLSYCKMMYLLREKAPSLAKSNSLHWMISVKIVTWWQGHKSGYFHSFLPNLNSSDGSQAHKLDREKDVIGT